MNAVAVLVDALDELATTGRLTDDTRAKLSECVQAERYGHPGFRPPEIDDGSEPG